MVCVCLLLAGIIVGIDFGDIGKVLSAFQTGRISYDTLFAVGDLCRVSESGDCTVKLIFGKNGTEKFVTLKC